MDKQPERIWPARWQQAILSAMALLDLRFWYALFRQRPLLALANGAAGIVLLVLVATTWRGIRNR